MAETLVLAELTVNAQGVVTGVSQATSAITGFDRKLTQTGQNAKSQDSSFDLLTKRMFNLRTAAVALVGSFSLAGVLFGIKNLVTEIVKGDSAFKDFEKSASGVLTQFSALARETLGVGNGLREAGHAMDVFSASMLAIRQTAEAHRGAIETGQGIIGDILFGVLGIGETVEGLKTILGLLDEATKKQQAQLRPSFREPGDESDWDPAKITAFLNAQSAALSSGSLPAPSPGMAIRLIDGMQQYVQLAERLPDAFTAAEEAANPLRETFEDLGNLSAGIEKGWEATEDAMARINETDLTKKMRDDLESLNDMFMRLSDTLTVAQLKFELILAAVNQFASQITTAITQGGITIRSFVADMLTMVGQMLLAWGALAVITTYFTGEPGFHVAAAAIAAGVGALLAARAIGGGREGPQAAQTGSGGTQGSGGSRQLVVNFGGPTFGFNEASFARYVSDLQRRGERTGG